MENVEGADACGGAEMQVDREGGVGTAEGDGEEAADCAEAEEVDVGGGRHGGVYAAAAFVCHQEATGS